MSEDPEAVFDIHKVRATITASGCRRCTTTCLLRSSHSRWAIVVCLQDKHKGQFALRKLYHESDRLIAVLYTAPGCGPCRSLKPIFNSVVEEYAGRIHYVEVSSRQNTLWFELELS